MINKAEKELEYGNLYPYDRDDDGKFSPPSNWAHRAARGIIHDLSDRGNIKHGFDDVDEDIRMEIVNSLTSIIMYAAIPLEERIVKLEAELKAANEDAERLAKQLECEQNPGFTCSELIDHYKRIDGNTYNTCPDCNGAGELAGDYFSSDGMFPCGRCQGRGTV